MSRPEAREEAEELGLAKLTAMVERVKAAGLEAEADMFSTLQWAWYRTISAYRYGIPYANGPEMTGQGAMHVTTYTINHWGPLIPGTPVLDNAAVLEEAAADEEWHRQEDRRMRRDAGEDII